MAENSKLNKLKSFIGILLIGFLGSGLWDFALKDFCLGFGNIFANVMSIVYHDYIENLYKNSGRGDNFLQVLPSLVLISSIIISPIIVTRYFSSFFKIKINVTESNIPINSTGHNKTAFYTFICFLIEKKIRLYIFILILTLPLSIAYFHMLITETSKSSAFMYVERDLEIIKPYTSEKNYSFLRSEFRLMNNRKDIENIYKKINIIAKKNKVLLPKKSLIGIELN